MKAVAFYKYQHHLPVYDPQVEKQNIEITLNQIEIKNLSRKALQIFLESLIQISRQIQQDWLNYFHSTNEILPEKDLVQLRQELATLTYNIVQQIDCALSELKDQNFHDLEQLIVEKMQNRYLNKQDKILLLNHLIRISHQGKEHV